MVTRPSPGSGNCRVVVVSEPGDWAGLLPLLHRHLALLPVLGLDCEWVSDGGTARPVCMLQLATVGGLVLLVRLLTAGPLPMDLRGILASPEVYKVGVAVGDDARKMLSGHGLEVGGCLDLRHLVLRCGGRHPGKLGLEALSAAVLGVALDKDWRLRAGDWEALTLTPRQVDYAANDALVGVNILWVVVSRYLTSGWLGWLRTVLWGQDRLQSEVSALLEPFVDLDFNNKEWKHQLREGKERSATPTCGVKGNRLNPTRRSPLYHNCMLQAPDGQVTHSRRCE